KRLYLDDDGKSRKGLRRSRRTAFAKQPESFLVMRGFPDLIPSFTGLSLVIPIRDERLRQKPVGLIGTLGLFAKRLQAGIIVEHGALWLLKTAAGNGHRCWRKNISQWFKLPFVGHVPIRHRNKDCHGEEIIE